MTVIRFGSVCSGIEAASVAWGPLGWRPAWFSEIEPWPCALLAHHYPHVPNLGDMLTLPARIRSGEVEAPDVFCGGTPCQAFSLAGNRRSLDDDRGLLSLTFCEIADAIDDARAARGEEPCLIFWENVHGALSADDNFFGCFLAQLAGEDVPLEPPGGKWTDAGVVSGPARTVAWRVLCSEYFGLAQRRKRVFVLASAGDVDPAKILFEFEGVRRDIEPRIEYEAAVDAGSAAGRPFDMLGFGQYGDGAVASTCKARDYKDATDLIVTPDGRVRRTTIVEVERLMGFPDGYTDVAGASDTPRRKALGNSWAVPVVRWIGARMAAAIQPRVEDTTA